MGMDNDHTAAEPGLWATEFPLDPALCYLNHAAVAPWPARAAAAVERFARENVRSGARRYAAWVGVERELRSRLAALIGAAGPDDIALQKNTSEALSVIAMGLPWSAGDNVVLAREEFPSNRIVWEALDRLGVETRQVSITGCTDPEAALLAVMDRRTRLLAVSSVQYGNGLRMDLGRLGRECRRAGVLLCVDAIQSLGALRFDLADCQADFVVADGHKWMLGPEGLALLWCRPELREQLTLHEFGWHMTDVYDDFDATAWRPAGTARRFECGSPNLLGVHALHASVGLLQQVGLDVVEAAVLARAQWLHERIAASDRLNLLSDPRPERRSGIVTFAHRRHPAGPVVRALRDAGVIAAARGGGIRFSPHFYTSLQTIEKAVDLAERIVPV